LGEDCGPKCVGPAARNPYNATGISTPSAEPPNLAGQIAGTIIAISESGNLVSDIAAERLRDVPREAATIACDEHETIGIYPADHLEEPMTLMAIVGPAGALELTIVGDSAAMMLGVRVGEKIVVKW
jgi:S-adenosylmethionine hydrolase